MKAEGVRVARGPRPCDSPMECMDLGLSHLTSLAGQSPAFSHNYCPDNFSPVRSLRSTTICSPGRTAALCHQAGQSDSSCRSRLKFNKLRIFKTVAVNIYTSRHVIGSSQAADRTRGWNKITPQSEVCRCLNQTEQLVVCRWFVPTSRPAYGRKASWEERNNRGHRNKYTKRE